VSVYLVALLALVALDARAEADETRVIQARIDAACGQGGGVVSVAPGDHFVRPLELKSGVTLRLEKGARLVASTNMSDYAEIPGARGQRAVIWSSRAENVALEGEGVVDGRGWAVAHLGEAPGRWKCCIFFRSRKVRIQDVTLTNPATWTCYLKECDGVHVKGVKIRSLTNWNNDGIDIDSKNVLVEDCDIDSDDDAICPKSDNADFICENVEVRNCRLASNCNHIKLGTASRGGFRNIWIHDCELVPCSTNIIPRIKNGIGRGNDIPGWDKSEIGSRCGIAVECVDGGILENVRVSDIKLNRCCQTPVFVRLGRRRRHPGGKASCLRNVTVENVRGESMSYLASSITGVPGLRAQDVTIRNVDLVVKGGGPADEVSRPVPESVDKYPENRMFGRKMLPAYGFYVRHADGVTFENVRLSYTGDTEGRPAVFADDASPKFVNCDFRKPRGENPVTMGPARALPSVGGSLAAPHFSQD